MKLSSDGADRCFNAVNPRTDQIQVGKRNDQANRSMAAHPQIAHIIEKDHSCCTRRITRLTKQCADHDIRSSGFVDDRRTKAVMHGAELLEPLGQWASPQV